MQLNIQMSVLNTDAKAELHSMHDKCTGALMQKAHFAETKAKCKWK